MLIWGECVWDKDRSLDREVDHQLDGVLCYHHPIVHCNRGIVGALHE